MNSGTAGAPAKRFKIHVVDDHTMMRIGLKSLSQFVLEPVPCAKPASDRRGRVDALPGADATSPRLQRLQRESHGYGMERRSSCIRYGYWLAGLTGLLMLLWGNP